MILSAHQPAYLPWLGLFHKIALTDQFIVLDQVQYQPEDWNNRNRIKTQQGPLLLSVPVLRKGYLRKAIGDLEIDNAAPWARKHWASLRGAYAKAPYYKRYSDIFQDIYSRKWERLVDLNKTMLKTFLEILGIAVPVCSASEWHFVGKKGDLILDMCQQFGASEYIFGSLGRDYVNAAAFEAANIKLHFQDYIHPVYPQLHGGFVSHLSIVDLLFNCGDESLEILMSGNLVRKDLLKGDM